MNLLAIKNITEAIILSVNRFWRQRRNTENVSVYIWEQ